MEDDEELGDDFKEKMNKILDKEKIKDTKYKTVSRQMFMEKCYAPGMAVNFKQQSQKAQKMIRKKKG